MPHYVDRNGLHQISWFCGFMWRILPIRAVNFIIGLLITQSPQFTTVVSIEWDIILSYLIFWHDKLKVIPQSWGNIWRRMSFWNVIMKVYTDYNTKIYISIMFCAIVLCCCLPKWKQLFKFHWNWHPKSKILTTFYTVTEVVKIIWKKKKKKKKKNF